MSSNLRKVSSAALLALAALLAPSAAYAIGETTGAVSGYVYDPTGSPIGMVPLTIKGSALQQPISRTSGDDGRFEFNALPPGEDYAIEVSIPDYTPIRQTGIHVRLGQTTPVDINLTVLTQTQAAATYTVVEKVNPVMNPDSAQAVSVVTAEKAAQTPFFHQVEGVPQQVAGTSFSNKPVTRGGLSRYGKFYVDGMDATDVTNGSITAPINFEGVENFEVITGGFDAQYNSMGMVENAVTKIGGNNFTYDAQLTLSPAFFAASNKTSSGAIPIFGNSVNSSAPGPVTDFYQPAINIGGPIIKDKLWFYAGFQLNLSHKETPIQTFYSPLENRPTDTVTALGRLKLTWQATSKDRLSLSLYGDHNTIDNSVGSSITTDEGEQRIDRGGRLPLGLDFIILNYDHNFTDDLLFQLQAGGTFKIENTDPEHPSSNPGHFDTYNFVQTTNGDEINTFQHGNYLHDNKTRYEFDPSLIWKLGKHQLKGGFQFTYMQDQQDTGVIGTGTDPNGATVGQAYTDHGGNCDPSNPATFSFCYQRTNYYGLQNGDGSWQTGTLSTNATAINFGTYIQDKWTVSRKLTLAPGFRVDYGYMKGDPSLATSATGNSVVGLPAGDTSPKLLGFGPRLSATYDLWGDRKTLLVGHYGRSNDVGNTYIAQQANPNLLEVSSFFAGTAFPNCLPPPAVNPPGQCSVAGGSIGRGYSPNQQPPHVDEIQVGYHQEALPETAFGIDLDYRRYSNMWADVEVNRIWDPSGQKVIGFVDPTHPQSIYLLQASPQAYREYKGVDLWVNGTPGHWDLLASYTLSFNNGTVGDYFDGFLQNPRLTQFYDGYLGDDHRHVFKASISYKTPFGLDLGARFRYQSGGALWETYKNPGDSTQNWYRSPRGTGFPNNPSTGLPNFNDPTTWSEMRSPDWFQIDAEVRYNLGQALGLKQKIEITAYLIDALNNYDPAGITTTYSTKGVNKFGTTSFYNGPLQGEVILRFRNF